MSGTPPSHQDEEARALPTRTLAIIKNHALKHRMTIERRILEASFEIIKERQMQFDPGCDQEFLEELFGRDTASLFEGPVWVYVLERRRAVEVWNTLMGEENPAVARQNSPHSLRAVYGVSLERNALMGSADVEIAEDQIACLFQSSPPFPPQEVAPGDLDVDEFEDLEPPADWHHEDEHPLSPSSTAASHDVPHSSDSGSHGARSSRSNGNGKVPFRARPMPRTTLVPSIQPRTTKAAALRAGIVAPAPKSDSRPRTAPTREEMKQVFLDVPGHKRSSTIQVASTAPPVVPPRMTRAASLRIGEEPAPVRRPRPSSMQIGKSSFEGVPGHKRKEKIPVASVQAPTVAPRLNKSSELRVRKESAPPTSYMFRPPTTPKVPGAAGALARSPSQASLTPSRSHSSMGNLQAGTPSGRASALARTRSTQNFVDDEDENTEPVRLMPPRPPSIEPRSNRSALLRAKMGGPVNGAVSGAKKAAHSFAAKVSRAVEV